MEEFNLYFMRISNLASSTSSGYCVICIRMNIMHLKLYGESRVGSTGEKLV